MPIGEFESKLVEAARNSRLLLMDCDGILTDGRLYYGEAGESMKVFDVRDGLGIVRWHEAGFTSGIISGRNSPIVERRASELRMGFVRQGVDDKVAAANSILEECGVSFEEAIYIGDDLPDIDLIRAAGIGVAVADAAEEVRRAADFVTRAKGGHGAVRELIDSLIRIKAEKMIAQDR